MIRDRLVSGGSPCSMAQIYAHCNPKQSKVLSAVAVTPALALTFRFELARRGALGDRERLFRPDRELVRIVVEALGMRQNEPMTRSAP